MDWTHAIPAWLDALRDEMRYSAGTLTKYQQAAMHYRGHMTCELNTVREADVRAYLSGLRELAPTTVRVYLSAIKSLHSWVSSVTETKDPTLRIRAPRRPDRLPKALSHGEVLAILRHIPDSCRLDLRDRAILEVMYSSGCRSSEVRSLRLQDLRLDEGRMHVIGKGNRERVCLLGPDAVTAVNVWLTVRGKQAHEFVFVSYQGNRLSAMGLWKMVRDRCRSAGIERHIHPHMFRHTCATHLLRGGADLRSIQLILGHRNISSTQGYLSVDDETLRNVHAQTHPRGRTSDLRLRTVGGRDAMREDEKDLP